MFVPYPNDASETPVASNPANITSPLMRFDDLTLLRRTIAEWRRAGDRVILVPTMGALHSGHLALIAHARTMGERVIASIFVNPTQFGPNEDFTRYPRDLETDLQKLEENGTSAVWIPSVETMYPPGFATSITIAELPDKLCGPYRPGHFAGVATVVTKLLTQIRPDTALFGEKDWQQLQVIKRVVRDLDMDVTIVGMPTIRESDGLALSSRNRYLSEDERRIAPRLHRTLENIAHEVRSGAPISTSIRDAVASLQDDGFSPIQYVSLCDPSTLTPIEKLRGPARVLAAAYLGKTRLIDNVEV